MAVVASATGVALGMTAGTVGAGLVGGAVLGAGAGALYSGITGDGNILNSALTGAAIGGGIGGLGAAIGPGLLGAEAAGAGAAAINPATGLAWEATGSGLAGNAPAALAGSANTPALASSVLTGANTSTGAALANASADPIMAAANMSGATEAQLAALNTPATVPSATSGLAAVKPETSGMDMLGYGLAGTAALSLLGGMNQKKLSSTTGTTPSYIRPYTYTATQNQNAYPTTPQYGSNGLPILPTKEQSYFNQSYTAGTPYQAAEGGLMTDSPDPAMMKSGLADVNFMGNDMYPTSQQHRSYYATPNQMPTSAQEVAASYEPKTNPLTGQMTANMADGGYTYDAATQKYSQQLPPGVQTFESMAPSGFGLGATRFANFGETDPLGGNPFGFGGGENLSFQPATSLDPQSLAAMTSQWQAQNPNKRTYDPATQRYGYATPDQGTLLAMKNAQDQAAYQAQQQAYQSYNSDNYGGGANGGLMPYNLGSYSDGGRLLKGPGDGVSDDIPAVIGQKQPARLADGEFVIPARIVSELGNGSTDAGAKRLYAMMDRVQEGRKKTVGKDKVAVNTKSDKHLPA